MDKEVQEGYFRQKFRDLEPFESDESQKAFARYISAAPVTPLGHEEVTVGASPTPLPSVPAEARRVVLRPISNPITFCDDGSNPSASHGMIVDADSVFIYDTDPDENFLLWAASNTEVRIAYYG